MDGVLCRAVEVPGLDVTVCTYPQTVSRGGEDQGGRALYHIFKLATLNIPPCLRLGSVQSDYPGVEVIDFRMDRAYISVGWIL